MIHPTIPSFCPPAPSQLFRRQCPYPWHLWLSRLSHWGLQLWGLLLDLLWPLVQETQLEISWRPPSQAWWLVLPKEPSFQSNGKGAVDGCAGSQNWSSSLSFLTNGIFLFALACFVSCFHMFPPTMFSHNCIPTNYSVVEPSTPFKIVLQLEPYEELLVAAHLLRTSRHWDPLPLKPMKSTRLSNETWRTTSLR